MQFAAYSGCCVCVRPSGERGGPQQHPWEVGAAFTAGFITYSQALLPPDADGEDGTTPAAAAQPAPRGAAAGSAAGPAAGSILQPLGGSTMRRSTLLQGPSQVGPAGPQQQHAQPAVSQPMQARGVDRLRLTRRFMPYPQPYPLGPALLEAQMWLLGKLLSVVNTPTLLQVGPTLSTQNHCMVVCHTSAYHSASGFCCHNRHPLHQLQSLGLRATILQFRLGPPMQLAGVAPCVPCRCWRSCWALLACGQASPRCSGQQTAPPWPWLRWRGLCPWPTAPAARVARVTRWPARCCSWLHACWKIRWARDTAGLACASQRQMLGTYGPLLYYPVVMCKQTPSQRRIPEACCLSPWLCAGV